MRLRKVCERRANSCKVEEGQAPKAVTKKGTPPLLHWRVHHLARAVVLRENRGLQEGQVFQIIIASLAAGLYKIIL